MTELISLVELKAGQEAIVRKFSGGQEVVRRLSALGLKLNKKVKKISGMFLRGPVTVQVGHTRMAIGHGMAEKLLVEVKR